MDGRSVWVSASLSNTAGMPGGATDVPGDPPVFVLARHAPPSFASAPVSNKTSEKPRPSALVGQGDKSLYVTESNSMPSEAFTETVSPPLESLNV